MDDAHGNVICSEVLNRRRAGILLHITSLPGTRGTGDLGADAYRFVEFLEATGVSIWQMLPLGVPHDDGSPYQCLSAHAGNPLLISLEWLADKGWLEQSHMKCHGTSSDHFRKECLRKAFLQFKAQQEPLEIEGFKQFCDDRKGWLDDYALFVTLREEYQKQSWFDWPEAYKNRQPNALNKLRKSHQSLIDYIKFEQYVFFAQWLELKSYAQQHSVLMFGDIPIFVAYDSADVWANRSNFKLDSAGTMTTVAGVPPDYFSATGQRWGNPLFDWSHLQETGFEWWVERIQSQLELFDIIRIDHFRGLQAAWEIPSNEETAINGQWVAAPGEALLSKITAELGSSLPLIAEDLGVITPDVEALRDKFNLPGMKILQFAFDGGPSNPYLPFNFVENCVVYTGTHDNDTTLGWYGQLPDHKKNYIKEYLGFSQMQMPNSLVHCALASIANIAIIPMQDILELGAEHRMNMPGTIEGNWQWRFQWEQLTEEKIQRLTHYVGLFGRRAV